MTTTEPTTTTDPDATPDGSPRDHWTRYSTGPDVEWRRHTYALDAVHDLADQLTLDPTAIADQTRILDASGDLGWILLTAAEAAALNSAREQLDRLAEQPADQHLHPATQGPDIGPEDLMLDTGDLKDLIAHSLALVTLDPFGAGRDHGINRDQVAAEQDRIRKDHTSALIGAAIEIACRVRLLPDSRGVVPVRRAGTMGEAPEQRHETWMLAYAVPGVRGLYVSSTGHLTFWGEQWGVVSGSGYVVRHGFMDRLTAEGFARALAEAMPGLDFRAYTGKFEQAPPGMLKALAQVAAEWGPFGKATKPAATAEGETR